MTNPTSNFGWVMPNPTDLVTDLPADFEVFGQAVDTSMADLKGGTTGQILSKATNTDMDFTWITNDVGDITAVNVTAPITGGGTSGAVTIGVSAASTAAAGVVELSDSTSTTSSVLAATPTAVKAAYDLANAAIAKSTVTTAGDIIYRNGTVPTRLAIGTANQVLRVNSGATAPEWANASSGALTLIKRAAFTGVATTGTTFDDVFTSTYKNYLAVFEYVQAATYTDDLQVQLRYAGPTTQAATYYGSTVYATQAGGPSNLASNNTAQYTLANNSTVIGNLFFGRVGNTSETAAMYGSGTDNAGYGPLLWGCTQDTARIYTGFLVKSASSNVTGTIAVYGLATA